MLETKVFQVNAPGREPAVVAATRLHGGPGLLGKLQEVCSQLVTDIEREARSAVVVAGFVEGARATARFEGLREGVVRVNDRLQEMEVALPLQQEARLVAMMREDGFTEFALAWGWSCQLGLAQREKLQEHLKQSWDVLSSGQTITLPF